MIKPTNVLFVTLYCKLDIPFKTMIKPTENGYPVRSYLLDIPFKTMIKPTVGRMIVVV